MALHLLINSRHQDSRNATNYRRRLMERRCVSRSKAPLLFLRLLLLSPARRVPRATRGFHFFSRNFGTCNRPASSASLRSDVSTWEIGGSCRNQCVESVSRDRICHYPRNSRAPWDFLDLGNFASETGKIEFVVASTFVRRRWGYLNVERE